MGIIDYCSDHLTKYTNIVLLHFTPADNLMLYVSYTLHAYKHFHFIGQKNRGPEKWNGSLLFRDRLQELCLFGSQMATALLLKKHVRSRSKTQIRINNWNYNLIQKSAF